MRILWVCNIMLPRIAKELGVEGSAKEGWLSGLCDTILERRQENEIELHVAFPANKEQDGMSYTVDAGNGKLYAHSFYEDISHAERYDNALEASLLQIIEKIQPDVVHCFGTEYAHTLAVAKCFKHPERLLIGMQGVCRVIAEAYMADLPEKVQNSLTFRDWLKQDSIKQQQQKFVLRGKREAEILKLAGNVTGRTAFDHDYVQKCNPKAEYYTMNETLRGCFYEGQWVYENCEKYTIFLSQGDYPLKGLHYLLIAAGRLKVRYPDLKINVAGNSLVNDKTIKDKIKISGYGSYLRRLIAENGLEDRIHFLGRLNAEEMKAQYLKCGLYVCCSANENSPNSLGEAMLLGVPCVAADVGGISSLFTRGEDGILYSGYEYVEKDINNTCSLNKNENLGCDSQLKNVYENSKEQKISKLERISANLESAIDEMWKNQEKMLYYCKNAREHARKTHDKEQNYRILTEIYAKITNAER